MLFFMDIDTNDMSLKDMPNTLMNVAGKIQQLIDNGKGRADNIVEDINHNGKRVGEFEYYRESNSDDALIKQTMHSKETETLVKELLQDETILS